MDIIILLEISFLVLLPAEFISKMSRSREGNFKRLSNFSMLNIAFNNILILNLKEGIFTCSENLAYSVNY